MDTTRDVAIARLAQALDVPPGLLSLPAESWNCADEHEWKKKAVDALARTLGATLNAEWRIAVADLVGQLEYVAVDIRYRNRLAPTEPVITYLPEWVYEKFTAQERATLAASGITIRTSWDGEEPQPCYTVPCPSF